MVSHSAPKWWALITLIGWRKKAGLRITRPKSWCLLCHWHDTLTQVSPFSSLDLISPKRLNERFGLDGHYGSSLVLCSWMSLWSTLPDRWLWQLVLRKTQSFFPAYWIILVLSSNDYIFWQFEASSFPIIWSLQLNWSGCLLLTVPHCQLPLVHASSPFFWKIYDPRHFLSSDLSSLGLMTSGSHRFKQASH